MSHFCSSNCNRLGPLAQPHSYHSCLLLNPDPDLHTHRLRLPQLVNTNAHSLIGLFRAVLCILSPPHIRVHVNDVRTDVIYDKISRPWLTVIIPRALSHITHENLGCLRRAKTFGDRPPPPYRKIVAGV
jgi:hypothetical protein